jgi:hypothetical protein
MNATKNYDPIAVGKAAEAKNVLGDLEGAQFVYQSALMEWQDDAMGMEGESRDHPQWEQLRHAIASLWLSYANFNRKLKQVRKHVVFLLITDFTFSLAHFYFILFYFSICHSSRHARKLMKVL